MQPVGFNYLLSRRCSIKCFRNFLHLVLPPFVYLMKKLINSLIENMTSIKQLFLLDVTLNMLFDHTLTREFIRHLIKKGIDLIVLPSIFLTIQLNRLHQIILEINKRLLFVINITNPLEVQYSTSINWLLILIFIERLQIAKPQYSVINQQAILLRRNCSCFK